MQKDRIDLLEGDTECLAWPLSRFDSATRVERPLLLTEVSTVTCTIRDAESGSIINSRTSQNVKNANNGVVINGEFELALQALDTAFVTATNTREIHVCEIKLTATDAQVRTHILEIVCLRRQTAA